MQRVPTNILLSKYFLWKYETNKNPIAFLTIRKLSNKLNLCANKLSNQRMKANEPYKPIPSAKEELAELSTLLSTAHKPVVPMPNDAYFGTLVTEVLHKAAQPVSDKKRTFRIIPFGLVGLAAAASITLAIILWPIGTVSNNGLAFDSLSNDDLLQLAMQDEALLDNHVMQDDSLMLVLSANPAFQYLDDNANSDDYNSLLLEMIDDETLLEDWL